MAAPVYVSVGTETQQNTSASATANRPASVADGDLLIMIAAIRANPITITTPAGWTKIVDDVAWGSSSGTVASAYVFWKIAASEPSTYSLSASASGIWQVNVVRVTGAYASAPIDQVAYTLAAAGAATFDTPTVTTTTVDCLIASIGLQPQSANMAPPGSLTERFDRIYNTPPFNTAWGDKTQASPGATGTFTWTQTSTALRCSLGITIAVASTGAGPPPSTFVPQIVIS